MAPNVLKARNVNKEEIVIALPGQTCRSESTLASSDVVLPKNESRKAVDTRSSGYRFDSNIVRLCADRAILLLSDLLGLVCCSSSFKFALFASCCDIGS